MSCANKTLAFNSQEIVEFNIRSIHSMRKSYTELRLTKNNSYSTAVFYDDIPKTEIVLKPESGWSDFWKKLSALETSCLPDSSELPDDSERVDENGSVYHVAVLDGGLYRVQLQTGDISCDYSYDNPSSHIWPEAKKLQRLLNFLSKEFKLYHALGRDF